MGDRFIAAFRGTGLPEDLSTSGLQLSYFTSIPNASVAIQALDLVTNPATVAMLGKAHTEEEIAKIKRATYRACIAYGVPLPSRAIVEARMLDIVVPT